LSRRRGNLLTSFNYAFDGIVHSLRTERNMWVHFAIAALVLIAALFFALTRLEVVALLVAISFVVITEMFNTSIEHVVDLVTDEDDPRARIAKDVAAGAVLVAAVNAIAVAYLVFYDKITSVPYTVLSKLRGSPIDVMVIALFLVILAAIALKAATHRGTAFHGGWPSVHAAVAFGTWVAVTFLASDTTFALPISAITMFLALLVAQSRVQAKIHTLGEVAAGAALGIAVTALLFRVWYPI
jgi:diacylglycerol kinase (ATP)